MDGTQGGQDKIQFGPLLTYLFIWLCKLWGCSIKVKKAHLEHSRHSLNTTHCLTFVFAGLHGFKQPLHPQPAALCCQFYVKASHLTVFGPRGQPAFAQIWRVRSEGLGLSLGPRLWATLGQSMSLHSLLLFARQLCTHREHPLAPDQVSLESKSLQHWRL